MEATSWFKIVQQRIDLLSEPAAGAAVAGSIGWRDRLEPLAEQGAFWKVRSFDGPQRDATGWVLQNELEEVLPATEIDKDVFFEDLDLAARRFGGVEPDALYAIAYVESGVRNVIKANGGPIGPFQYTRMTWKDEIALPGCSDFLSSDITDPYSQTVITTLRCIRLANAIHAAIGRDPDTSELRLAHMLPKAIARLLQNKSLTVRAVLAQHYQSVGANDPGGQAAAVVAANGSVFSDAGQDRTVDNTLATIRLALLPGLADAAQRKQALSQRIAAAGEEAANFSVPPTGSEPQWLKVARQEMANGVADGDARIGEYFERAGLAGDPQTAWCAAFVSFCLAEGGITLPRGQAFSAWAADWRSRGTALSDAKLGAIVCVPSPRAASGTHVGFATGWDSANGTVRLLAGNQSNVRGGGDTINEKSWPAHAGVSWRWPV